MRTATLTVAALAWAAAAACADDDAGAGDAGDAGAEDQADADALDTPEDPWPDVPSVPQPVLVASDLSAPCGLALGDDTLYVAEEGADRIVALPLDGGPPEEIPVPLDAPTLIAAGGGDLFVTERTVGDVVRIRDGAATVLASGEASPGRVRTDGAFAYWVMGGTGAADGAIRRVSVDGGTPEDVVSGLASPRGLAVTSERCYFTETGTPGVGWAPLSGGDPVRFADSAGTPIEIVADEAADRVFWSSPGRRSGGWIHRSDLDFTIDTRLAFSPPGPTVVALDASRVFWSTGQTISWVPREGGAYEDLVVEVSVCDLVVARGSVWWTDASTGRVSRRVLP